MKMNWWMILRSNMKTERGVKVLFIVKFDNRGQFRKNIIYGKHGCHRPRKLGLK